MANRVTAGVNPLNFHQNASHSISSGGCAFDSVECGMSDPVEQKIARGGDEVSGLIPEVGKPQ